MLCATCIQGLSFNLQSSKTRNSDDETDDKNDVAACGFCDLISPVLYHLLHLGDACLNWVQVRKWMMMQMLGNTHNSGITLGLLLLMGFLGFRSCAALEVMNGEGILCGFNHKIGRESSFNNDAKYEGVTRDTPLLENPEKV
ncbi:unnamed protein product [Sphagnum jensenii]